MPGDRRAQEQEGAPAPPAVSSGQAAGTYSALDAALDPILILDDERRCAYANRAASALFGYSHEQLIGMTLDELVPDRTRDALRTAWSELLGSGALRSEVDLCRANGSSAVIEMSATPDSAAGRHLVILRDVTDRRRAEQDLRESKRRLEETQALSMVGSWEWNLDSDLRISSPELLRILGRPADSEAPSYEEFVNYVHPEDRDAYNAVAARALQDHQPFHQVFRILSDRGEVRTVESHGRVDVDENGAPVRMYGAAQDITEHERAEAELRMQADVLHQLPAGIVASDTQRRITQWNRGAQTMFGIPADEVLGRQIDEIGVIAPKSQALREQMRDTVSEGRTWEGEIELNRTDGHPFPALVTNSPTRNHRGEIVGYVGVIVDLSDQRRFESELLVQGRLLDQVNAAVVGLDPEGTITHWNRGAEGLSGWERAEAVGRSLSDLGLIDLEDSDNANEKISSGFAWEGEVEMNRKDGSSFPTLTSISPARDADRNLIGFVGVAVDITARKQAEDEARDARMETLKRLARAVEARDPETGGHIERIGEIAAVLATRMGLNADRAELIRVASPMHDVGKIGIPDKILLKPGPLTPQERAAMEEHAVIGHDMLSGSGTELLELAAVIALTHHERVDGDGYPRGLAGDEIPIEGRIVAVADVFDALTSDRVYRKAMSTEQAVEIMREGRGTQFDPRVLAVLLDDIDAFVALRERRPD